MGKIILAKIVRPYVIAALVCIAVVFILRLLDVREYHLYLLTFVAYAIFAVIFHFVQNKMVVDLLQTAHDEIEETLRSSVANNPLPLCLVSGEGVIVMMNEKFKTIFPEAKIFKTEIAQIVGETHLKELRNDVEAEVRLLVKNSEYSVRVVYISPADNSAAMFFFLDMTEYETLKRTCENEKTTYMYLNVDNYEDILQASPDQIRSIRAAAIENTVLKFAEELEGALLRYRDNAWLMVFPRKSYQKLKDNNFAILDTARSLENDADFPTSFSLGIGLGDKPILSEEFADYALDLARGRGGDQAVVKTAEHVSYYGGRVQVIENRNKGKSRVMSHAIRQLIKDSEKVLIMGHKYADIDTLGSAIALYRMSVTHGKEATIVMSTYNKSLDDVMQTVLDSESYKFLHADDAIAQMSADTLLIIIDVHVPEMIEEPALISKAEKMILIDHHRKRENVIENATLTYLEPNASSTAELVTEILQFDEEIRKLNRFEAELLLGGIFIDTNYFSVKTGTRTFEAAAWLRMNGAETTRVRQYLRTDVEDFRQRANITVNAEFSKTGIAISKNENKYANAPIIIAQAADQLLDIKGVRASFVVGATSKEVVISARSLGDVNVQVIMERFGGGGHLTMAAAQIKDMTIDEVITKLKKFIREAEGENK